MAYQVLARKWRPRKFEEVVGQAHITRSLQNAINDEKLGHAYLFSGTRGVGKTSVARIFAKAIRCPNRSVEGNPCLECSSCLEIDQGVSMDVVEMDGASNNGVDDIKSLLEMVYTMPMFGHHKIYIIDEVHMLSTQAFNALLKTLEEPPEHVIFIFATTEPQKLLGTVLSRCQRFDFRHVSLLDLEKHLSRIAKEETIIFETPRLVTQICELGQGSVRDTLSILDQVLSYTVDQKISEDTLVISLGLARTSALRLLIEGMIENRVKDISNVYYQLISDNVDVHKIVFGVLEQLYLMIDHIDDSEYLEQEKIISPSILEGVNFAELFWIFELLNKDSQWALNSFDPIKSIEIIFQKIAYRRDFFSDEGSKISFSKETCLPEKKTEKIVSVEPPALESLEDALEYTKPAECLEDQRLEEDDSCLTCGTPIIVAPDDKIERNWENFLSFLDQYSPGGRARLEQGDITKEPEIYSNRLIVDLCYKKNSAIFYEHIIEKSVQASIIEVLATFYNIDKERVSFEVKLLDDTDADDFVSRAEKRVIRKEEEKEQIKNELKDSDMLKKAQELFGTGVDQVKVIED